MAHTIAELQTAVADRIQDQAGRLPDLNGAILEALRGRYSKARPATRTATLAGDGAAYSWDLTDTDTFPGWVAGFSVPTQVEYPAGQRIPVFLTNKDWFIVYSEFRLGAITPAAGENVKVVYTALHADDISTVPDGDFDGLANLCAHLACKRLAAIYAQAGSSALGADSVNQDQKPSTYLKLADKYEEAFKEAFGLDKEEEQPAASETTDWEEPMQDGRPRLTH